MAAARASNNDLRPDESMHVRRLPSMARNAGSFSSAWLTRAVNHCVSLASARRQPQRRLPRSPRTSPRSNSDGRGSRPSGMSPSGTLPTSCGTPEQAANSTSRFVSHAPRSRPTVPVISTMCRSAARPGGQSVGHRPPGPTVRLSPRRFPVWGPTASRQRVTPERADANSIRRLNPLSRPEEPGRGTLAGEQAGVPGSLGCRVTRRVIGPRSRPPRPRAEGRAKRH
jgi:hypothetical protein